MTGTTTTNERRLPRQGAETFRVLGVNVDAVQIPGVVALMQKWIAHGESGRYISATGMHGIMEAHHTPAFKNILNSSALVVPDGAPLVWLGRLKGHALKRRVYGPDLLLAFCERTREKGIRHFFYGGAPGVPEKLAQQLSERFPGLVVAGTCSPPFRELTGEEDREIVRTINDAAPDVVWVGISTPKQERWMFEHSGRLNAPVIVGVGAAFDFHSGSKRQAPRWMREHGLEWFYRLMQEPGRLGRRYIVYGTEFVFWVTLDLLGLRRSE